MGVAAYCPVRMADGASQKAGDIDSGQSVLDPLTGGGRQVRDVWQGPAVGMCRIETDTGLVVDCTEDQHILTEAGWLAAGSIGRGTGIRTSGGMVRCAGFERLPGDFMVYDIVLSKDGDTPACLDVNSLVVAARA